MFAPFVLLVAAALQLQAPPQTAARTVAYHRETAPPSGVVRGRVLSETNGEPLAFAVVEIVGAGRRAAVVTDSTGVYSLRNVSPGLRLLRAQHLDHASLEVEVLVPSGGEVFLDVSLALRPPLLARLHVRGDGHGGPGDTVAASVPELGAATVKALESSPGMAELGLAQAARAAPGGHEPVDPSDVLYVRGAASDLKLVLLDGAPVYAPFHLGGLIAPFEPGVLSSANLWVGGAPARYDGGLSYVMELETRRAHADRVFFSGAADMLSARTLVESPVGASASVMIGARAVHDLAALRFLDHTLPYGYKDVLGRMDFDLVDGAHMGITGFWNQEAVSLDSLPNGKRDAIWGNGAGSVRLHVPFTRTESDFTLAYGSFNARLPVGGARPLIVDGVARRTRLNADFLRPEGTAELRYGLSFEQIRTRYQAWPRDASRDSMLLESREEGSVGGGYVDVMLPVGTRVRLRSGARADLYSLGQPARISPRLAAMFLVSDHAKVTVTAGRYTQYVRAPEDAIVAPDAPATGSGGPKVAPLALAGATHFVVGVDQELGEQLRVGVETYFKTYDGLPATNGARTEASGLDLSIQREHGAVTGWLGYSLGWIWSADGRPNMDFFAGRHLVSLGIAGPLGPEGRFDLRFAYGAGLPFTAVPEPHFGEPNSQVADPGSGPGLGAIQLLEETDPQVGGSHLDEDYVRLDASISRAWQFEWLGAQREVVPYVKVINALDRRDGLFYRKDEEGGPEVVAALPILPILGVEWKF